MSTGADDKGIRVDPELLHQALVHLVANTRDGTTFRIYFPRLDRTEDLPHGNPPPLAGTPVPG